MTRDELLIERIGPETGVGLAVKRVLLVVAGIALMAVLAKVRVPLWPSPVPITMQTFGVLLIGAAYGQRLGLVTMLGYLAVGALGYDVFTSSSVESNGIAYMTGATGGYLAGYLLAVLALGAAARRGWDRSVPLSLLAMLGASALIYATGVPWLHLWIERTAAFDAGAFATPLAQTMSWGLTPYLIGDAMKLALAGLLLPAAWRLVGRARG